MGVITANDLVMLAMKKTLSSIALDVDFHWGQFDWSVKLNECLCLKDVVKKI